jgi:aryl-alcohol dehydrogenase-like predicted oxidoreductase
MVHAVQVKALSELVSEGKIKYIGLSEATARDYSHLQVRIGLGSWRGYLH